MKEAKATHLKAYRLNKNRFLLVSHPHYPSRFPYFNRLYALICFHIGTINLAFRRGVGLPLPLHQSLLFPLIFAKEHLSLALLAPPVTPSLSIPTTFSKAHQPLRPAPRPCLPSKKGRWHGCRGFSACCTVFR